MLDLTLFASRKVGAGDSTEVSRLHGVILLREQGKTTNQDQWVCVCTLGEPETLFVKAISCLNRDYVIGDSLIENQPGDDYGLPLLANGCVFDNRKQSSFGDRRRDLCFADWQHRPLWRLECPKCQTCDLIAFSLYRNGSCLVRAGRRREGVHPLLLLRRRPRAAPGEIGRRETVRSFKGSSRSWIRHAR